MNPHCRRVAQPSTASLPPPGALLAQENKLSPCPCPPVPAPATCSVPPGPRSLTTTLKAVPPPLLCARVRAGCSDASQPTRGCDFSAESWGDLWLSWSVSCLCTAVTAVIDHPSPPAPCLVSRFQSNCQARCSWLMFCFSFLFFSCFFVVSHASECVPSLVTNSASLQKCLLGNSLWSLGFGIAKKMRRDDLPTQLAVFCWCWSGVSWYYHHFGSLFFFFFFFLRSKNSH